MSKNLFLSFVFLFFGLNIYAQNTAEVYGRVRTDKAFAVELMNVAVKGFPGGTTTNKKGFYSLKILADTTVTLVFSHIEYKTITKTIRLKKGERYKLNVMPEKDITILQTVNIRNEEKRHLSIMRLNPKNLAVIPTTSGGVESIIKTMPGVVSNNEMSSQYSVRGGNFDENLVYVNDIEIYKPQLIRSGAQEGLSFINSDMVEAVSFSAGGFEARYGDKMSSVLDIKYRRPRSFSTTFSASLLGSSAHVEGTNKNKRFTYSTGLRYKTSRYLLNSLDTKGEYFPSYFDFQTYLTFDIDEFNRLSFLGNISDNKYHLIPKSRETSFGTINQALGLNIYFDGQELDKYRTSLGALTYRYKPSKDFSFKLITSIYYTQEQERYDILGQYYLNELNKQIGSDNLGDSLMNIGVGSYLDHARNYFNALVSNVYFKGENKWKSHWFYWGGKYQHEEIIDKLSSWQVRDSAGFSLPFPDTASYYPQEIPMIQNLRTQHQLYNNRLSAYIQDTYEFSFDSTQMFLTFGVRANYWDYNKQFFVTPRFTYSIKPNWKKDFLFRLSTGAYYQSPFYKEYRNMNGTLNPNIRAQESYHFVLASDYNFHMWKRPFKFVTELYYKYLNNIIPYTVENVLIRYYADQKAVGYAGGIDCRIFGEFVPGVDSWASLSFMQSQEDIEGDGHGFIPRPTDQLFNASIFFQDYLPKFPNYKVHLTMAYGSGFPFGPPHSERYLATARMPAYFRTDIGFTAILKDEKKQLSDRNFFRHFKHIYLTAEIFNLMNKNNTISYVWVTDIQNRQYAVPNYLTGIRFNVKLTFKI
jgi:hypothetical protein